ncbi:MAG: hypothetical protein ABSD31_11345 [Candidatus Binataceae bacterium]
MFAASNIPRIASLLLVVVIADATTVPPAAPRLHVGDPTTSIGVVVLTPPQIPKLITEPMKSAAIWLPQGVLLKVQLNPVPGESLALVIL